MILGSFHGAARGSRSSFLPHHRTGSDRKATEPADDRQIGIVGIGPGRFSFRNFAFGPYVEASTHGGDDQVPTPAGRQFERQWR